MEIVTGLRKTPHISSNDMQSFQLGITGEDGAFPVGEIFRTELASNNELKVYDGEGVVGGVHFRVAPGTYDSITLENGSQGKKRKDLIVVRYTKSASDGTENTEWAVKKGTETTGTPTAPAATTGDIRNGDAIAELPMFEIEYNGLNVVEVTEKFQTLMSLKELRELVGSLNSKLQYGISGSITVPGGGNASITVTFPKPFDSIPAAVLISPAFGNSATLETNVQDVSRTQFTAVLTKLSRANLLGRIHVNHASVVPIFAQTSQRSSSPLGFCSNMTV